MRGQIVAHLGPHAMSASAPLLGDKRTWRIEYMPRKRRIGKLQVAVDLKNISFNMLYAMNTAVTKCGEPSFPAISLVCRCRLVGP